METRLGDHKRSIQYAAEALAEHGIHLETTPSAEVMQRAFDDVWEALGDRAIEEIYDLERMTDLRALDATETLFAAHPSAQALGSGAANLVACHLSRLALLHGNAEASCVGHAALGAAIIGRQKDHRTGTRLGKVALQLCAQRGNNRHHGTVAMKFATAMSIWTHPLQNSIDQCTRTYEIAMACGDGRAGSRLAAMIPFLMLLQGTPLDEVSDEALRRRRAIRSQSCDDEGMGDLCDSIERFVGQLKGRTVQRRVKSGVWTEALRLGHVACRILDLISLVLTYEYEAALFVSSHLNKVIVGIGSQIAVAEYWFWTMLALTATRTSGLPERFNEVLEDFERWADRCPQTFQHKHALLSAEQARLEGRDIDAMRAYDQAISEARENGFTQLEAFAAEAASRFYMTRDFPLIATTYFRTARNSYGRWGAVARVLQIDRRYPKLSGATEQSPSSPPPSLRGGGELDMFTAVKAAQTVSKEIVLQRLLVTLMKIVTEHVAAERCHILLEFEDGELYHAGRAFTTSKGIEIEVPGPVVKSIGDILPASIVEHVRTVHESVCIDEAIVDPTWTDDPYIASNRPRSVVCFPIMRQTTIVGMIYLENNSARGVFNPRRIALLEFLTNQAAISLEHAKLYADLARENTERRRAEQVLRKSEERMRRLVEIADVIPWEVDADNGVFTFLGAQAEKRLGWPITLWKKPNFLRDYLHADDRAETLAAFARACVDGKNNGIDFRLVAQDGQHVWLHMVIGSVDQENTQRILSGFFFDITERKEAETTLRDKLEIIERQKDNIRALSTPLLDVAEGIVAMPVLGELDVDRASRIMDVLLDAITKRNVHSAIIDLTGVSSIGNATAEQIGRIVRAVELVGARAIVAGIRADVARAIISLDVGLGRIETRASMKDALRVLAQATSARQDIRKNQSRTSR
jgi:PAS domain S-box-containing protein